MTEIIIDPVTRLEGHLEITATADAGVVTEAYSHGNMFRGIEKILIGRDPRDAPTITSRICGVCHAVHRLTSLRAIEDAAGFKFPGRPGTKEIPDGARIIRNLIQGITTVYSHAAHLYVLAGPDYSDAVAGTGIVRLDPFTGEGYLEAVEAQRILHEVLGILGGKVPHQVTAVPGGMSLAPTGDTINDILTRLTTPRPELQGNSVLDWVDAVAVPDILDMVGAAADLGAGDWGVGSGNFLCAGVYDLADGTQLIPSGVYVGNAADAIRIGVDVGEIIPMDPMLIDEDVTSGRYTPESGGYPGATVTEANLLKDAYTWYKAPRYDGMVVEVGPLARLVVNDKNPLGLRTEPNKSSTLNRLIARAQEILILIPGAVSWLNELAGKLPLAPEDVYAQWFIAGVPKSGIGLWEAPRGATIHWVTIDHKPQQGKAIAQYQVIAGTTWNGNGRDAAGQRGPFEQSLVGVPYVADVGAPDGSPASFPTINILRTIRSYDPCLGCSIHLLTPEGKKYTVRAV
jgi:Ni,Fe-hydrogenase I large subunit